MQQISDPPIPATGRRGHKATGRRPSPTRPRRSGPFRDIHGRQRLFGIVFVLPAAVYVGIFQLGPVLYGFYLSLTNYSPLSRSGPTFVGLANYAGLWSNAEFGRALLVTLRYVVQVLPPTVVIALVLALLANRPFRGVGFFRTALYVPHIISLTAVSMIWLWLYSDNGLVNQVLGWVHAGPQRWLTDEGAALNAASAMRVWKALGSNMVLLLAGLQGVPRDLYEAARVDGAGTWSQFRYVTLPGVRPMLTYVIVMDIIYLAQGFTEIFILTQGGPLGSTTTVNYLIYTRAFQYNQMGSASAMAFVLFAFIAGLTLLAIRAGQGRRA